MSDLGDIWRCEKCGWVNHGHADYCTSCILLDLKNKEVNLTRLSMALRGDFIIDTDDVQAI